MNELETTFAALADPTRRAAVELLQKKPRRPTELAKACAVSTPVMSRHLRILRKSGLIEQEDQGADMRARSYRLRQEPFSALRRWLDEVELYWSRELDAFKQHAERTRGRERRK